MPRLGVVLWGALLPAAQETPIPPQYHDLISAAAERLVEASLADMVGSPREKILVLPLEGDVDSIVTRELRGGIVGTGRFVEVQSSTIAQILELLGVKKHYSEINNSENAIEAARAAGAKYALFGKVGIEGREPRRRLDVSLRFRVVGVDGKGFFIGSYSTREEEGALSLVHHKIWIRERSAVGRIIVWALVMLVLPFAVLMFKELTAGTRPLLPVAMVVAFTAFDIFFAYALMGLGIESVWGAALFVAAMAASLLWNLFVMSKIAHMTSHGA